MSLLNSLSASNRGHKRCVAHKTRMVSDCDQGTMLKNRLMNHHRQQIWPEQRDASNQEVNATNISWRWPTQPRRKCRLAIRKCPRLNKHLESILYNLPFLEQMAIHTKNLKTSWRNRAYQSITRHNKDTKDTKNMYHWFGTFLSKSVSRVSLAIPPKLLHHDRRTKKELAKSLTHVIGRLWCQVERVIHIFYGLCMAFLLWKLIVMIVRIQAAWAVKWFHFWPSLRSQGTLSMLSNFSRWSSICSGHANGTGEASMNWKRPFVADFPYSSGTFGIA